MTMNKNKYYVNRNSRMAEDFHILSNPLSTLWPWINYEGSHEQVWGKGEKGKLERDEWVRNSTCCNNWVKRRKFTKIPRVILVCYSILQIILLLHSKLKTQQLKTINIMITHSFWRSGIWEWPKLDGCGLRVSWVVDRCQVRLQSSKRLLEAWRSCSQGGLLRQLANQGWLLAASLRALWNGHLHRAAW